MVVHGGRVGVAQVSPEATGGAGTIEEYTLAALALGRLLTGDLMPGLDTAPTSIALQRRVAGHALDDLVLTSNQGASPSSIDYQVKRRAAPTPSDRAFLDVLGQCLQELSTRHDELDAGSLRLGLAAGGPRAQLEELHRLTVIARAHTSVDTFLGLLMPGAMSAEVRGRYDHVKAAVERVLAERGDQESTGQGLEVDELGVDRLVHDLLRHLHVWIMEIGEDGRDFLDTLSRLAQVFPSAAPSVRSLFAQLRTLAEGWGPNAGVINVPMLRAALLAAGVALDTAPQHRHELERVLTASADELARTVDQIGGTLRLERARVVDQIDRAVAGGGLVLISGSAGVGKSVLARRCVQEQGENATVVAINLAVRGGDSPTSLQDELGIPHLPTALAAAPTAGSRILLIDGAENALADAGRLLEFLLDAAPTGGRKSPPWTVVITCRREAADPLTHHLGDRLTSHVPVGDLTDDEMNEVEQAFPLLAPLLRHPRSNQLLRRPYLVDLIVRSGSALPEQDPIGEETILDLFYNTVVRRSEGMRPGQGLPHERSRAWEEAAEAVITGTGSTSLSTVPGPAVGGLVSDDVLTRHGRTYRFSHDVLADYAAAMVLADDPALLEQVHSPRPLLRAVRLAGQRTLSAASDPAELRAVWKQQLSVCERLAARDGDRWSDVPYESALSLADPGVVLQGLGLQRLDLQELVPNTAGQPRLLDVARLIAVTTRFATTDRTTPDRMTLDGASLVLNSVLAAPVIGLLIATAAELSEGLAASAVLLTERWLRSLELHRLRPGDFGIDSSRLCAATVSWAGDATYGQRYESALAVLGLLGQNLPAEASPLLERAVERGDDLEAIIEDPDVAAALARDNPDLLLELAGCYYLDWPLDMDGARGRLPMTPRRTLRGRRRLGVPGDEDGIRDHSHRTARRRGFGLTGPDWGPFAVLLDHSPAHGLRLVGAVVDAATRHRGREEASFSRPQRPLALELTFPHWSNARTYRGPASAWGWYQRAGTGPYPAMSALMALRRWAVAQVSKRPLEQILDDVLLAGVSPALAAVGYSLLLINPSTSGALLDPFLQEPDVWDMETSRIFGGGAGWDTGEPGLSTQVDGVVIQLVLGGDEERRRELEATGERFLTNSRARQGEPAEGSPELAVARRRASMFRIEYYRLNPVENQPNQLEVSVELPSDLQQQLEEGGGREARTRLELSNHLFAAMKIRDESVDQPGSAAQLYTTVGTMVRDEGSDSELGIAFNPAETLAMAAAAVVVQAARGGEAELQMLPTAVETLLRLVNENTPKFADADRDMSWDFGADRSLATAITRLLSDDLLLDACGKDKDQFTSIVEMLSASQSRQVRDRLLQGLAAAWNDTDCTKQRTHARHTTAMAVYLEWILAAGVGPWNGQERPRKRLRQPLEEALTDPDTLLNYDTAADALPGLRAAARCDCPHGEGARRTLAALVEYDLRRRPTDAIPRGFRGSRYWCQQISLWVSSAVLDGNDDILDRYLTAFTPAPEELAFVVESLALQAVSTTQGQRSFEVWPRLLDQLLPAARSAREASRRSRQEASRRKLDEALLPIPQSGASWPPDEYARVIDRWVTASEPSPDLVDRLLLCLAANALERTPQAMGLVLRMIGPDGSRILGRSQYVETWLRDVVREEHEPGSLRRALLQLVDNLARRGSSVAILVQKELEQ